MTNVVIHQRTALRWVPTHHFFFWLKWFFLFLNSLVWDIFCVLKNLKSHILTTYFVFFNKNLHNIYTSFFITGSSQFHFFAILRKPTCTLFHVFAHSSKVQCSYIFYEIVLFPFIKLNTINKVQLKIFRYFQRKFFIF